MKIYGDTNSGNCLKVKWVCDKLALPYQWIEIDTRNPERPKLNLEVVIDGKVAYKWVLRPFMSVSNVDRFVLAAYP